MNVVYFYYSIKHLNLKIKTQVNTTTKQKNFIVNVFGNWNKNTLNNPEANVKKFRYTTFHN